MGRDATAGGTLGLPIPRVRYGGSGPAAEELAADRAELRIGSCGARRVGISAQQLALSSLALDRALLPLHVVRCVLAPVCVTAPVAMPAISASCRLGIRTRLGVALEPIRGLAIVAIREKRLVRARVPW
jgi:hypothetical protein